MDSRFSPSVVEAAKATQRKYYVPSSVTMAQWAVESAYGKAMPAGSNNPFGIKAATGQAAVAAMTREERDGVTVHEVQRFAVYSSLTEAFEAHGKLLATHKADYGAAMKAWLRGDLAGGVALMSARYATDRRYDTTIMSVIHQNGLDAIDHEVAQETAKPILAKAASAIAAVTPKPVTAGSHGASSAAVVTIGAAATGHPTAALVSGGLSVALAALAWLLRPRVAAATIERVPVTSIVSVDAASIPSSPAAPAAAASAILPAASESTTMSLSTIVGDVASIAAAGSNPVSGMLAGVKIAAGALPMIFRAAETFAGHLPEVEAKFRDLEDKLTAAWQDAQHLDVNAVQTAVGEAWQDASAIYDLVGLPRSLVSQVIAVASGDNTSPSFATEAKGVAEALAKQFGIAL